MKTGGILLLSVLLTLAGCATLPPRTGAPTPENLVGELRRQSFSADELNIQVVGPPGSQTIRWKETISPKTAVTLPLLPNSALSTQPRILGSLNGGPRLPFSIDTGAGVNLVDAAAALRHGVKVADPEQFGNVFKGLGGAEFSYYGMFDRVDLGGLSIKNLLSVLRVAEGAGERVDNLLGLTTLAKFAYISLDFPNRRAIFALDGKYTPERPARAQAPIAIQSLHLLVDIQVNGQYEMTVVLDSGNDTSLMLTEEMIASMGLAEAARRGRPGRFLGIGGVIETRTFLIDSIALGEARFPNVDVTVVPNDFPPSLGSGFLSQFRATIDFKQQTLWLE